MKLIIAILFAALLSGCTMPNHRSYIPQPDAIDHDLLFRQYVDYSERVYWSAL